MADNDVNNQDPSGQAPAGQDPNATALKDNGTDNNTKLGETKSAFDLQTSQDLSQQKIQDELFAAVKRGDRVRVEELIDQGADVNKPDNSGTTAIMDAVANNDMNISRDFLQQKANGNTAYDPAFDPTLTGIATNQPGANGITDAATALAMGLTAADLAAQGNFSLAAQVDAVSDDSQERLEQNDDDAALEEDGDFSYASSAYDDSGLDSDDDDDDDGDYDMAGDDYDDPYGDSYDDPYDDGDYSMGGYDDPYGYDDAYSDPYGGGYDYGASDPTLASGYADPTMSGTGSTSTTPSTTDPSTQQSSFASSFMNLSTDVATIDVAQNLYGATPSSTSSFFDMSSPVTGSGNIWSTQFFDPAAVSTTTQGLSLTATAAPATPTIAPTNPYYRPSAGSSLAM